MKEKIRLKYGAKAEGVGKDGKKHIVYVYGELKEGDALNGMLLMRGSFNRKNGELEFGEALDKLLGGEFTYVLDKGDNTLYSRKKEVNMGYAICHPEDEFNEEVGVQLAKKRFSKSPMTTQTGNFLTPDVVKVMVEHEAKFIADHIDNYLP